MKITKSQLNALIESFLLNEDGEYGSEVDEDENETSKKRSIFRRKSRRKSNSEPGENYDDSSMEKTNDDSFMEKTNDNSDYAEIADRVSDPDYEGPIGDGRYKVGGKIYKSASEAEADIMAGFTGDLNSDNLNKDNKKPSSPRGSGKIKYASPYSGNTLSEFQSWASTNGMPGEFMNYLDNLGVITDRAKVFVGVMDGVSAGATAGGMLSTEQGRKSFQQEQSDFIALARKIANNSNGPYSQQAFGAITDKANSIIEYIYSNSGAPVGPGTEWSPSSLIDQVRGLGLSMIGDTSPKFICSDSGSMIAIVPMTVDYQKNNYIPALEKDMPHPVDVEIKKLRSFLSRPPGYQSDIDIKIPGSNNYLEPSYIVPIFSINDVATSLSLVDKLNAKKQLTKSDIDQQIRDRGQDLVKVVIAFTLV